MTTEPTPTEPIEQAPELGEDIPGPKSPGGPAVGSPEAADPAGLASAEPMTAVPTAPPTPAAKFCFACGASIDARAEICPKCGVRQPLQTGMPGAGGINVNDATTRTGKTKLTASLLAIFLGGLGIHKFYLGDTALGVVYLIFCWTFIPAIIGLIEGIIWLTQSNEVWLAKYGDR